MVGPSVTFCAFDAGHLGQLICQAAVVGIPRLLYKRSSRLYASDPAVADLGREPVTTNRFQEVCQAYVGPESR